MKLCLVGSTCGKTSIIQRWIRPSIPIQDENTIAIDMKTLSLKLDDNLSTVQIWDCSGDDSYTDLLDRYLFNSNCTVVCFDLCEFKSWEKAKYWIKRASELSPNAPIFVLGNKVDLESKRMVKYTDVKRYVDTSVRVFYCECSAFTGENCKEILYTIVRETRRRIKVYTPIDLQPQKNCTIV
jgi:small GTP-binding protein